MKKVVVLTILFLTSFLAFSQIDCTQLLANRKAEEPFKMSSLSKSAFSISGHTYKYEVPLQPGKEYRIIFLASPVFNNNIHFKIIDKNTNKVVVDVPGENDKTNNAPGTAALVPYTDPKTGENVYPHFDVFPNSPTKLDIIIDVGDAPTKKDEYGNTYKEVLKGCIAVVILEKPIEKTGF